MSAPLQHFVGDDYEALCGAPYEIRLTFFASTGTATCPDCIAARDPFVDEVERPAPTVVELRPPEPQLIHELEKILESARKGELRSFAIVCLYSDTQTMHLHAGATAGTRLLGALRRLEHAVLHDIEEHGG